MDASTIGVVTGSTVAGGSEARSAESADGVDGGHAKHGVGGSGRGVRSATDTGSGEAKARTGDTDIGGGDDGERNEAYGMRWAMPPEAASRVGVGTLRGWHEARS